MAILVIIAGMASLLIEIEDMMVFSLEEHREKIDCLFSQGEYKEAMKLLEESYFQFEQMCKDAHRLSTL